MTAAVTSSATSTTTPGPLSTAPSHATAMTCSLDSPPTTSGTPASDSSPNRNETRSSGAATALPRSAVAAVLPATMPAQPIARNSSALKIACDQRWNRPASGPSTGGAAASADSMTPTWLTVDQARSLLRSLWANASTAARSIVTDTERPSTQRAPSLTESSGKRPASTTVPAATIVAAWMRALAGVGPSMASASQSWNGTWADLPRTPMMTSVTRTPRRTPSGVSDQVARTSDRREDRPGREADHAQDEPDVGEPGHEEGLVRGAARGVLARPVADEEVGAPAHDLPADDGEHEVAGVHDEEHRGGEERDGRGEDRVAVVGLEVPGRVDLHAKGDERDDGRHGPARRVGEQLERHLQPTGFEGGPEGHERGGPGCRPAHRCEQEGQGRGADRDAAGDPVVPTDGEPGEGGQRRDEHDQPRAHGASPLGSARSMLAAVPEGREHDRERHDDLGRGDRDDEERQHAAGRPAVGAGGLGRHEQDEAAAEHELDTDEEQDGVAAHRDAEDADPDERGGEEVRPDEVDHAGASSAGARGGCARRRVRRRPRRGGAGRAARRARPTCRRAARRPGSR